MKQTSKEERNYTKLDTNENRSYLPARIVSCEVVDADFEIVDAESRPIKGALTPAAAIAYRQASPREKMKYKPPRKKHGSVRTTLEPGELERIIQEYNAAKGGLVQLAEKYNIRPSILSTMIKATGRQVLIGRAASSYKKRVKTGKHL